MKNSFDHPPGPLPGQEGGTILYLRDTLSLPAEGQVPSALLFSSSLLLPKEPQEHLVAQEATTGRQHEATVLPVEQPDFP